MKKLCIKDGARFIHCQFSFLCSTFVVNSNLNGEAYKQSRFFYCTDIKDLSDDWSKRNNFHHLFYCFPPQVPHSFWVLLITGTHFIYWFLKAKPWILFEAIRELSFDQPIIMDDKLTSSSLDFPSSSEKGSRNSLPHEPNSSSTTQLVSDRTNWSRPIEFILTCLR